MRAYLMFLLLCKDLEDIKWKTNNYTNFLHHHMLSLWYEVKVHRSVLSSNAPKSLRNEQRARSTFFMGLWGLRGVERLLLNHAEGTRWKSKLIRFYRHPFDPISVGQHFKLSFSSRAPAGRDKLDRINFSSSNALLHSLTMAFITSFMEQLDILAIVK